MTMKQLFKTIILMVALSVPATVLAHDFEVNGILYDINGNEATVTHSANNEYQYSGEVIIPSSVTYEGTTYPVTAIGNHAFMGATELTRVSIPNSVSAIGIHAFSSCNNLTDVNIPDAVTVISAATFYYCTSLTNVHIPDNVTEIGNNATRIITFWLNHGGREHELV